MKLNGALIIATNTGTNDALMIATTISGIRAATMVGYFHAICAPLLKQCYAPKQIDRQNS